MARLFQDGSRRLWQDGDSYLWQDDPGTGYQPTPGLVAPLRARYKRGAAADRSSAITFDQTTRADNLHRMAWGAGEHADADTTIRLRDSERVDTRAGIAWGTPAAIERKHTSRWADTLAADAVTSVHWGEPEAIQRDLVLVYKSRLPRADIATAVPWGTPESIQRDFIAPYTQPAEVALATAIPWGPGGSRDTSLKFTYEDYVGPIDDGGGVQGGLLIPTLRFYIVSNSASIVRVSDGRDIPASQVSLSINADSYSWDMSAALAGKQVMDLVEGTDGEPVEVDVVINDVSWRVLIDGWRLSESWHRSGGTIRGRSRAAYLASPYAAARDYAESSELLAQQLADQELPFGWTLDWGIEDWIVDAGAWSYAGLAPIDAIARIAQAGGGYVQANRITDTIHVRPKYPAAPWSWLSAVPDFMIPRAIMIQRDSDKKPGQGANGVFIHGGDPGGILAKVVRTGSGGNVLTKTVVDPLITDTVPARYRGIALLAATGRQSIETHELPLSADYGGLIDTGSLIVVGEESGAEFLEHWRGLVRGVTVQAGATRANNGGVALTVRQRIEIERHFED